MSSFGIRNFGLGIRSRRHAANSVVTSSWDQISGCGAIAAQSEAGVAERQAAPISRFLRRYGITSSPTAASSRFRARMFGVLRIHVWDWNLMVGSALSKLPPNMNTTALIRIHVMPLAQADFKLIPRIMSQHVSSCNACATRHNSGLLLRKLICVTVLGKPKKLLYNAYPLLGT